MRQVGKIKIKQVNQAYLRNPHKAGKAVLEPKCEIHLKCEKRTLDYFKIKSLSKSFYDAPLPHLKVLPSAPSFSKVFHGSTFKAEDLSTILCSRRNGSSPGIDTIPYKVYKKCPQIVYFLFNILKSTLTQSTVPIHWRVASEVYNPMKKPPNPELTEDF